MKIFFAGTKITVLLIFTFCAALNLSAQEEGARIYRVEGPDFALTVQNKRTVYAADVVSGKQVPLDRGGTVHTDAGTLLELQLVPSGTVVKLAENTSLIYNGIDETGKFADLGLLYGRIRVVTGNGAPFPGAGPEEKNPVVIRGGGVSARMEQGDMGVDYVLEAGSAGVTPRPLFRVYTFRGNAALFPYGKGGTPAWFGSTESLAAEEGTCLSIDVSSNHTFAEKTAAGKEIAAYWTLHNFAGAAAPLPMPDTAITAALEEVPVEAAAVPPAAEAPPRIIYVERDNGAPPPVKLNNRGKDIAIGVGLALIASSAAVQGISYSQFDTSNGETAQNFFKIAYIPLGLGLLCTLTGILQNPSQQ